MTENENVETQRELWFERWRNDNIGFHKSEVNPSLVKHFSALSLLQGSRVFVPLCGKTLDIAWLLAQGYYVIGAELVEGAVEQLFQELGVEPKRSDLSEVRRYSAAHLDIFVGDVFSVSGEMLGSVDAVYDRAALIALAEPVRERYAAHLTEITRSAPQLLITYEFDQRLFEGPPFSVSKEEVERRYRGVYHPSLVESLDVPEGLKGMRPVKENVWVLRR